VAPVHLPDRSRAAIKPQSSPVRRVVVRRPALVSSHAGAKRFLGLFAALAVPGFLLASSIPAIAVGVDPFTSASTIALTAPAKKVDVQNFQVTSSAVIEVDRSTFKAESHAQFMARRLSNQIAAAHAGAYSVVGPRQAGDDYPWRAASGGLSPLRYVSRQCTDFVAWRLNRDAGSRSAPFKYTWSNLTPNGGSAGSWPSAWANHGWKTSHKPAVGAVAYIAPNHVAYVKSVNSNGTVFLEEYNWGSSAAYNTRVVDKDSVSLYLYAPPR
jgi:peptidoglycan DL-endopeptidase CwlO